MLHNEARKLLIQALERSHNVREMARNYSVNWSNVYRLKSVWMKPAQLKLEPTFVEENRH